MEHISFSQLNMLLRCPQQYEFRYIQNLVIPPQSAIVFGKACHKTIEEDNKEKLKTGLPLKLSVMQDVFVATLEEEPEIIFEEGEKLDNLKDEGTQKIIPLYAQEVSPKLEPEVVEDEFEVVFNNTPYSVKGKIDLVDKKQNIHEFKFVKRIPCLDGKPLPDLQPTFYALGYKIRTGKLPKGIEKTYFIRTKTPKTLTSKEKRRLRDLENLLLLISKAIQLIKTGIFLPNFNSILCNEKACGYFELCKRKWSKKTI